MVGFLGTAGASAGVGGICERFCAESGKGFRPSGRGFRIAAEPVTEVVDFLKLEDVWVEELDEVERAGLALTGCADEGLGEGLGDGRFGFEVDWDEGWDDSEAFVAGLGVDARISFNLDGEILSLTIFLCFFSLCSEFGIS
jgi:hypothetical protein